MIAFTKYCFDLMTHSNDTNDTDNEYSNQKLWGRWFFTGQRKNDR